jgi:hypothetical protein
MSIKWMRWPYHYITVWYICQKSTLSTPNFAKAIVMTGSKDTVIWLPTTYKVCQMPFICMKWIWYEYAGDGRAQSYPTACPQWNPLKISTTTQPTPLEQRYGMVLWQIWLPTMVEGFTTLSIGMKWIWYEYAGDGRAQSYPTVCP